jgi:hypothetical protein
MRAYRDSAKLTPIRLERLSSAVMIALFAGVPDRIEFEEPHHGLQFGVHRSGVDDHLAVDARGEDGHIRPGLPVPVAVRQTDPALRVVELDDLRRLLSYRSDLEDPAVPTQTGSAAFAMQLLRPPWKQVFSDEGRSLQPAPLLASIGPRVAGLGADVDIHQLFDDGQRHVTADEQGQDR